MKIKKEPTILIKYQTVFLNEKGGRAQLKSGPLMLLPYPLFIEKIIVTVGYGLTLYGVESLDCNLVAGYEFSWIMLRYLRDNRP